MQGWLTPRALRLIVALVVVPSPSCNLDWNKAERSADAGLADAASDSTADSPNDPRDGSSTPDAADGCGLGFRRDEASDSCVDIHECDLEHGGCDAHATCQEHASPGMAPTCVCEAPYAGDGKTCALRVGRVVTGVTHACALGTDRSLWCWGSNRYGQLGTGDATVSVEPRAVSQVEVSAAWDEVALGSTHTCALRDGILYCWGNNELGGLGLGATAMGINSPVPTALEGAQWFGLSSALNETCALRGQASSGELRCWGDLSGSAGRVSVPTTVGAAEMRWRAISTSGRHACGIRVDGALFCWGEARNGKLGLGSAAATSTFVDPPTQVGSATDWLAVDAGNQVTCGIRAAGELWCWGFSASLPAPESENVSSPKRYGVWDDWTKVSAADNGAQQTCAIRSSGGMYCWGGNECGAAGQPWQPAGSAVPLSQVGAEGGWSDVSTGGEFTCGVRAERAHCWGSNGNSKLGRTTELHEYVDGPMRIGTDSDWATVSAGSAATCGVRNGLMHCWGARRDVDRHATMPEPVATDTGWTSIVTGHFGGALGIMSGRVYRWGGYSDPLAVPTLEDAALAWNALSIRRGDAPDAWSSIARCGIRGSSLLCWGENSKGQLGVGDTNARTTPTELAGTWTAVTQGVEHTCAIDGSAQLFCWGSKTELGIDATTDQWLPVRVGTESGWTRISAAGRNTCGIRNGEVYCWQTTAPSRVGSDADWTEIAVWGEGRCAIRGGALYCWGNNFHGRLGLGLPIDNEPIAAPTLVDDGVTSKWQGISLGARHGCGVRGDGSLWCWGKNRWGEVGTGPSWSHIPLPVDLAAER